MKSTFSLLSISAWITALLFVFVQLYPLLLGVEPAGWDLPGHLYLYKNFLLLLSQGQTHGYDFLWGGGYPTFSLYPPGGYLIAALPHLVSGGAISELHSFNLSIFFTAVGILIACSCLGTTFAGRQAAPLAVLFGMFLLATPPEYDYLGLGLAGAISTGLFTNFVAVPFFILMIAALERQQQTKSWWWRAVALLSLSAVYQIHTITFIFSGWVWFWFFVFAGRGNRITLIGLFAGALVLNSPCILLFLRHLPYSSGVTAGLWGESADPLFPLLAGLTPSRILEAFSRAFESMPALPGEVSGGLPPVLSPIKFPFLFLNFPYVGILTLISLTIGLVSFVRQKKYFLPVCYLVGLVLLPRNFLSQDLPHPIHYYRFIQHLAILQIALCATGLKEILNWSVSSRAFLSLRPFHLMLILFLLAGVATHNFLNFSLLQRSVLRDANARPYRTFFTLEADRYPGRPDAEELMLYLKALNPTGRVATETSEASYRSLGSPHFFSSQLPMRFNIPTVPGLLAESMLSSSYINPVMMQGSEHLHWGNTAISMIADFSRQSLSAQIERLKLFGVQYIISTSGAYYATLTKAQPSEIVREVRTFGQFGLFEVLNTRPLAESLTSKPFLYLAASPREFRDFSEWWYVNPRFFDTPVIYTPHSILELSKEDLQEIGGFILPDQNNIAKDPLVISHLEKLTKPVIVVSKGGVVSQQSFPNFHFISWTEGLVGIEVLRQKLDDLRIHSSTTSTPIEASFSSREVSFVGRGATLVRASFGPDWWVEGSKRTVFWATPCHILVFGVGNIRLLYGK